MNRLETGLVPRLYSIFELQWLAFLWTTGIVLMLGTVLGTVTLLATKTLYAQAPTASSAPSVAETTKTHHNRHPVPPLSLQSGLASIEKPIPRTGNQPLLVILIDFPDRPGLFRGDSWYDYFFGDDGFAAYYREVSYRQLRYSGDIVGLADGLPVINQDAVAYVRLPHPITFYADGSYGFDVSAKQFPQNHGGAVTHALEALDQAGFNFTPYASPLTNEVENLIVIFAGSSYAYTRDADNSLEATAYRLTFAGGGVYRSRNGQLFDNYTFCPDQFGNLSGQQARIGVCAHEHGHALGMSDLYDFSYTTTGAGNFDLMAYGTFGATEGTRPFHFGAFSKMFLGWSQPDLFTGGTVTIEMGPTADANNLIKLAPFGNVQSREYFLLENRQPRGFDQDWAAAGLCPGLLIWHVDEQIVEQYPYAVNTITSAGGPPHPGVALLEADGGYDLVRPPLNYGECSDTWQPGERWHAAAPAGSNLWDGTPSGLAVTVLAEDDGVLTLRIEVEQLPVRVFLPMVVK